MQAGGGEVCVYAHTTMGRNGKGEEDWAARRAEWLGDTSCRGSIEKEEGKRGTDMVRKGEVGRQEALHPRRILLDYQ